MMSARKGFTILELVIVLAIGGILTTVLITQFGGVQTRLATRSAQTNFLSMHAHARSLALERGVSVQLMADATSGEVEIREGCLGTGDVIEARNFTVRHGVALEITGGTLLLCMTPRGYADPNLNSFVQEATVAFVRDDQRQGVVLLPLGQALRP